MDHAQTLRLTDPSAAIGILRSIKDTPGFPYQAHCGQQYAIALRQSGQPEVALKEFEKQLSGGRDKNPIRANNLRFAAETAIALGRFDKVDSWLKEAGEIFELLQDPQSAGQIMRLRGVVEAQKGDLINGQAHLEESIRIAKSYRSSSTVETTRTSTPALSGVGAY